MRILVVDDDEVFREELQSLLQDEGHDVTTAASAPKGIQELEGKEYDLLFTDLKMPRQSGMSLLKEARARWPRLFVVMITGFATVETAVEAMKFGAFDYIRKPFQVAQIQHVLRLTEQQMQFSGKGIEVQDPGKLALAWAKKDGFNVLYLGSKPPRAHERIAFHALDPNNPAEMVDAVSAFVPQVARPAVILSGVEGFFVSHRLEEVVEALSRVRAMLDQKGPLAIGFDPHRLSEAAAVGIRATVTSPDSGATLEALTSPIRRQVLRRFAEGPGTFTDAMKAAKLDDSPKLSFHIRRLVDEGLIVHADERYQLTPKGEAAVHLLGEIDELNVGKGGDRLLFALPTSAPPVSGG
ncbi:MAG TPA: response regulator [Thermoplasmata archaeon]|nr:response regulator [Thermoplasmata archaeon]